MKILTLIVHSEIKQALADTLLLMSQVSGFTFTNVEGHGAREKRDRELSARDQVVGYVPQVRVDILLEEQDVRSVLAELRENQQGLAGRARYWVVEVESSGKL